MSDATTDVLGRIAAGEYLTPGELMLAKKMSGRLGFHKESNGDMMIAWYPPLELAQALAIPGGEAPEDLHLTIVFIPGSSEINPEVVRAVTLLCTQWNDSLEGNISGTGRFVLDDTLDAFFVTVDVPRLENLRTRLLDELCEASCYVSMNHGFTPHITLQYLARSEPSPGRLDATIPIVIDALTVQERGGVQYRYDLWSYDESAAEDPYAIARARKERTEKAGLLACVNCGAAMMVQESGMKCCVSCKKSATDAAAEKSARQIVSAGDAPLTYVALPHPDSLSKGADGSEWQYTLGPLYAPGVDDAHGEFAEDDDLHRAVIEYSLKNDRRLKLQHDTSREVGTWVELMRWPYPHTIVLDRPGEASRTIDMPAGTVYMGVLWDDDAWAAVKDGSLGGLSLGGRAVRINDGGDRSTKAVESAPVQSANDVLLEELIKTLKESAQSQREPVNINVTLPQITNNMPEITTNVSNAPIRPRVAKAERDATGALVVSYDDETVEDKE